MSTTTPIALKPGADENIQRIYDSYLSALGDSDKAGEVEAVCYYDGLVDAFVAVLTLFDALEDETWRKTYAEKPEWWDDPTEPRCDVCGVHTEEACTTVALRPEAAVDAFLARYPGAWCGECGNCADHCECGEGS
jgi:hypothetical protein